MVVMLCPRIFVRADALLPRSAVIAKTTCRRPTFEPNRSPRFSSHQTGSASPPRITDELPLSSDGSPEKHGGQKLDTVGGSSISSASKPAPKSQRGQTTRSTRTYPVRKQFIYESYVDLFTSNQVCLLFKHHALSSRQWNSIRGQIKNLSSPLPTTPVGFGEIKFSEEDEETRLKQQVPQVQVLRTKMILPVLKKLLKSSKINKQVYNSLVYNHHHDLAKTAPMGPSQLTGSLFSITQPRFEPDQIKKILTILNPYSTPEDQKKLNQGQGTNPKQKVQFFIGLIDQTKICKDQQELKRLSNLDSLDSLRSQIISLLNLPAQNLISSLNFARGSNLIFTLNSHIKTQQLLVTPTPAPDAQPSDHPSPSA